MANNEKSQSEDERQARVYKASDVHKRRASGKRRLDAASVAREDRHESKAKDASGEVLPDNNAALQEPPRGMKQEGPVASAAKTEITAVPSADEGVRDSNPAEDRDDTAPQQLVSDAFPEAPLPDEPEAKPARRRSRAKTAALLIGLALALVVVGLGAVFAWDRWGRYDDFADMQGDWYVAGATASVSIDGNRIQLTEDVSYDFEIDDHAKTISYTFGPLEGQGRYWFSDDRRFLAITDGEGYNGAVTAFEDIGRRLAALTQPARATGSLLPEGKGVVVLCRQPGKLATLAVQAQERGRKRAEKQKAAEEEAAARKAAEEEERAEREGQGEDYEQMEAVVGPETAAEGTQAQDGAAGGEAYEGADEETESFDQESYDEQPADDGDDEGYDEYA